MWYTDTMHESMEKMANLITQTREQLEILKELIDLRDTEMVHLLKLLENHIAITETILSHYFDSDWMRGP